METITIKVRIACQIDQAWEYYTQPKHITQWNFATPEWQCPSASNELIVGGKYVARMEAKDKSFGFDFEAIYTKVKAPNHLAYTMGSLEDDGRKATVDFKTVQDETELTIVFEPELENDVDMQRSGWQAILNNFKSYCEKQ